MRLLFTFRRWGAFGASSQARLLNAFAKQKKMVEGSRTAAAALGGMARGQQQQQQPQGPRSGGRCS